MKTTSCILVTYFLAFTLITYAKTKDKEVGKEANIEQVVKKQATSSSAVSMLKDLFSASGDFNENKSSKSKNKDKSAGAIGDPFALSGDAFHEDDPWPKYN